MQTGYVPMKNEKSRRQKPETDRSKEKRRKPDYSELRKAKRGD